MLAFTTAFLVLANAVVVAWCPCMLISPVVLSVLPILLPASELSFFSVALMLLAVNVGSPTGLAYSTESGKLQALVYDILPSRKVLESWRCLDGVTQVLLSSQVK